MAKQTINIGASPNDGTGTPLRTAFDYCNLNFTELYTAVGPSGNNIVCPGAATISGNLTVDTNTLFVDAANNRVGFGTATPNAAVEVRNAGAQQRWDSGGATDARVELWANSLRQGLIGWNSNSIVFGGDSARNTVMTWQDVGGVAGTAMTLNANGLGVGMSPLTDRLTIFGSAGVNVSGGFADISFRNSPGTAIQRIRYTDGSGTLTIGSPLGTSYPVELGGNTTTRAVTIDASSNVGIGVTPITPHILSCAGPVGITGTIAGTRTSYITNSNTASIYYTDGGGSGYFTDFGNLIIQPRTSAARSVVIATGSTTPVERAVVKSTGQVRFVPLAADPSGAEAGDVYYNSVSNRLKYYNGTAWTLI